MRASEFIVESKIPDVVYHGTASANLTNIMKHGIKPKLNRYAYSNRQHGGGIATGLELEPGKRRSDLETISTSVNFDNSLEYAKLGGSTGSGSPGVELAFRPLPSDSFEETGMPGEVVFRNAISPDRLQIVWPQRLAGKEKQLAQKAEKKKQSGAEKTQQIKSINQQLKAAGSSIRIKSTNPNTARIAIWFMDPDNPVQVGNTNIDDQNFAVFLKKELANPAPNKQRYYGRTNWLNEFAPEGFEQYSLYTGDGVRNHLVDKFSSLNAAKEEVEFIWDSDPEARLAIWFIKNLNDEVVWSYDPQEIADAPRYQFRKKSDDLEEMNRRGFLGAMGAGAMAAAGVPSQAANKVGPPMLSANIGAEEALHRAARAAGIRGVELAQFLAQCYHESGGFKYMQELGDPRYFLRYDPRVDPAKARVLGNVKPGDGERYKGRGFIQITGRDNYRRAGEALGLPLEDRPELAARMDVAARIAVWYWKQRVKPNVSNFNDTRAVTRQINPNMRGLEDRHENFKDYKKVFSMNWKAV
jgi:predicted chitinase